MTDRDLTPAVTDADQKVARALLRSLAACAMAGIEEDVAAQAIARARADADEAGYSRGLREGAASERERLGVWADFGSWAFESFWDEGEPGDLDWCDLQEEAINLGLLTRRSENHAAYNCADGCEWLPGRPFGECDCLFPNKPPLAAIRARGEGGKA